MKLKPHYVEKPWGRTELPPAFASHASGRIGEIWYAPPDRRELPLLAKYIFTSEKLSIQVHPSDAEARARGLARGKNECWYIVDAEPDATLGVGLKRSVSHEALREAALDGSIEDLLNWIPVQLGDFFYVPAGTVHAIGAGIALIELQQNADVTYRLYDYGRPRELHLDDGIAVSRPEPYSNAGRHAPDSSGNQILVDGPAFAVMRATTLTGFAEQLAARDRWVIPLVGTASCNGETVALGECLLADSNQPLSSSQDAVLLIAAAGPLNEGGRRGAERN